MRLLFLTALIGCAAYLLWLPDVRPLRTHNPATTAYIELRRARAARSGRIFHPVMIWTPWDAISDNLKNAVLTSEDDEFYHHHGIDWDSVRIALAEDWQAKKILYGASTITQQVARNLYLSPSKNPLRKIKEMLIAKRLERTLSKRRIFEIYLNIAEWGRGIFGAEAASEAYFGKSASDLTPEEAAALAVVLPSPLRHNPASGGRYVERNMRRVMERMRESGLLPEEADLSLLVSTTSLPLPKLPPPPAALNEPVAPAPSSR